VIKITDAALMVPQDQSASAQRRTDSKVMTHRMRLKSASLAFAVLWTGTMMWWSAPLRPAEVVILMICGALAGPAWYLLYGRWYRWHFTRRLFPRKHVS